MRENKIWSKERNLTESKSQVEQEAEEWNGMESSK